MTTCSSASRPRWSCEGGSTHPAVAEDWAVGQLPPEPLPPHGIRTKGLGRSSAQRRTLPGLQH